MPRNTAGVPKKYKGGYKQYLRDGTKSWQPVTFEVNPSEELTPDQKKMVHNRRKRILARTAKCAALTALFGGIVNFIGYPGQELSASEAANGLGVATAKKYGAMSLKQKYEASYIDSFVVEAPRTIGGRGMLSNMINMARIGQTCLADTGYDTSSSDISGPSHGNISAAAHLWVETNGDVMVTPYGSDSASSLRYVVKDGELMPTPLTESTLAANGCLTGEGLPVSATDSYTNEAALAAMGPFIHPSDYNS